MLTYFSFLLHSLAEPVLQIVASVPSPAAPESLLKQPYMSEQQPQAGLFNAAFLKGVSDTSCHGVTFISLGLLKELQNM